MPRTEGVDPALLPAFESLQRAIDVGDDTSARAILNRLLLRQPRGRALEVAQAYERILDGRAVVRGLDLHLECRVEPAEEVAGDAALPEGARVARLYLVAARAGGPVELRPGPATLFVTRSIVDAVGLEQDAVETHSFEDLGTLAVERGKAAEVSLARFFLSVPEEAIAARLRFEIELRSGTVRIVTAPTPDGKPRDVPAMRLRPKDAEETVLEHALAGLPAVGPEALAALASGGGPIDLVAAVRIAVRIAPDARERALELLAPILETIPESDVRAMIPALRWIAMTAEPGGDARAWRAWLREREEKKSGERPRLILPRAKPAT